MPDRYTCSHCNKEFSFSVGLIHHIAMTHRANVEKIADQNTKLQFAEKCWMCNREYNKLKDLMIHIAQHHPNYTAGSNSLLTRGMIGAGSDDVEPETPMIFGLLATLSRETDTRDILRFIATSEDVAACPMPSLEMLGIVHNDIPNVIIHRIKGDVKCDSLRFVLSLLTGIPAFTYFVSSSDNGDTYKRARDTLDLFQVPVTSPLPARPRPILPPAISNVIVLYLEHLFTYHNSAATNHSAPVSEIPSPLLHSFIVSFVMDNIYVLTAAYLSEKFFSHPTCSNKKRVRFPIYRRNDGSNHSTKPEVRHTQSKPEVRHTLSKPEVSGGLLTNGRSFFAALAISLAGGLRNEVNTYGTPSDDCVGGTGFPTLVDAARKCLVGAAGVGEICQILEEDYIKSDAFQSDSEMSDKDAREKPMTQGNLSLLLVNVKIGDLTQIIDFLNDNVSLCIAGADGFENMFHTGVREGQRFLSNSSDMYISRVISERCAVVCGNYIDIIRLERWLLELQRVTGQKVHQDRLPEISSSFLGRQRRDVTQSLLRVWNTLGFHINPTELMVPIYSPTTGRILQEEFSSGSQTHMQPDSPLMRELASYVLGGYTHDLRLALDNIPIALCGSSTVLSTSHLYDFSLSKFRAAQVLSWSTTTPDYGVAVEGSRVMVAGPTIISLPSTVVESTGIFLDPQIEKHQGSIASGKNKKVHIPLIPVGGEKLIQTPKRSAKDSAIIQRTFYQCKIINEVLRLIKPTTGLHLTTVFHLQQVDVPCMRSTKDTLEMLGVGRHPFKMIFLQHLEKKTGGLPFTRIISHERDVSVLSLLETWDILELTTLA